MTPQQLTQMVLSAQQPLSAGLTQAVGNTVQGDLASRGLAESPGIFATTESQALAPFYQQNQQAAQNQVLQQLQLPLQGAGYMPSFAPNLSNNIPALMAALKALSSGKPNPYNVSLPTPTTPANIPTFTQAPATDTSGLDFAT